MTHTTPTEIEQEVALSWPDKQTLQFCQKVDEEMQFGMSRNLAVRKAYLTLLPEARMILCKQYDAIEADCEDVA